MFSSWINQFKYFFKRKKSIFGEFDMNICFIFRSNSNASVAYSYNFFLKLLSLKIVELQMN